MGHLAINLFLFYILLIFQQLLDNFIETVCSNKVSKT